MLLILTVADIRAVGPGVWNGWKGQLLRTLYWETEVVLGGGHSAVDRKARVEAAQEALRRALPGWSDPEFDAYAQRHYPAYWLKVEPARQVAHAKLLHAMAADVRSLATEVSTDGFRGVTARDRGRARSPAAAQRHRRRLRRGGRPTSSTRRSSPRPTAWRSTRSSSRAPSSATRTNCGAASASPTNIERTLRGEVRLAEIAPPKETRDVRRGAFAIEPEVDDRQYALAPLHGGRGLRARPAGPAARPHGSLSSLNLNIGSAHIVTFGEKAVDAFYVTDLTGQKINSPAQAGGDQAASAGGLRGRALTAAAIRRPAASLIFAAPALICVANSDGALETMSDHERRPRAEPRRPRPRPSEAPERDAFAVIEALNAENSQLKDRILRTLAEMENLRRRTEREVADAKTYGVTSFARDMLTVVDNLARALEHLPAEARAAAEPQIQSVIEGVELTARDLEAALGRHGVKKLDPKGQKFDPNFHQAIFEAPDETVPAGTVSQVVQSGWTIGDRVLRPAMVGISKGGPKAAPKE